MPAGGKPPRGGDDGSVDVETLFDFEEAPATDPNASAINEEITLEIPAVAAAAAREMTPALEIEAPVAFAPLLPEMQGEIWQAGIQALVTVPEHAEPSQPARAEWLADARLFQAEGAAADSPAEAALLLAAAARAAEIAGDVASAADGYDEALGRAPRAPDVLRARARLAESVADFDEAHALWARLAVAAEQPDERAFYGALSAEWTLARRGTLPAVALDALAAGPARALAVAEASLREGTAAGAAAAFAAAGRALGGAFGVAFLEQAARFSVVARDAASTTDYRAAAAKLGPGTGGNPFAGLGEAARLDGRGAAAKLSEILAALPVGSRLAQAVARWAASLARARGDFAAGASLLARADATTAAASRDRIDLAGAAGEAPDAGCLRRLRETAAAPAAAAILSWIEASDLVGRGEYAAAAVLLQGAIEEQADAVPLALLAEEIAADTNDSALRATTLDLWLRGDPARRAEAALALAATREAAGSGLAARAALQTAVEAAPESLSFWTAAAADVRAGRRNDAAAVLGYGAAVWEASALAPVLHAMAALNFAPSDPARAIAVLGAPAGGAPSDFAQLTGVETLARLAERAADRELLLAVLTAASAAASDPAQRAWLALRRASATDEGAARTGALEEALAAVPAHPEALPLYLAEPSVGLTAMAAALVRAGAAAAAETPAFGRLAAFAGVSLLAVAGDREGALLRATDSLGAAADDRAGRRAVARAAARFGGPAGARAVAALPIESSNQNDARSLAIAEARIDAGLHEAAGDALGALAGGRFGADARRAAVRLTASGAEALPPGLLSGPSDHAAAAVRATLGSTIDGAIAGRWDDLVGAIASAPPHEAHATPATLAFAALLAEGHGIEAAAGRLVQEAVRVTRDDDAPAAAVPLLGLGRVADAVGDAAVRRRALTLATSRLGAAESDRRSAAAAQAERARLEEGADPTAAVESWRAALAADPTSLPAARALRLAAARTGDAAETSTACETEAACLLVPAHRVQALLLAAALAAEADPPNRERALELLRAALAVDPTHESAFERLRVLLTEQGNTPALAAALAARIEVAHNPFEVTSLRLARADLLAGAIGDFPGAREELESVLRKQPEHARALERLSELLWNRQSWAEAGEIYLKRAVVERDPPTLQVIFLRLGAIYSHHVPDAKRAAAAYERVLSIDADNLEALRALSEITVAEGEIKRALPVTDRLVAREPDAARRQQLRVRLGEILMQTGDLRRANIELRRAVEEAPRDVAAVGALAQLCDRARDLAGRRAVLDRAVGLLRHDLARPDGLKVATLRALASILALRERPHAALAAAQLVAALGAGAKEGVRAGARGGRSLAALRRPEIDDRAFSSDVPPGIRQILRQLGPLLRPSGHDLAQKLARHGVTRADRRTRGVAPRPLFDGVAAELGVGEFDLYVKALPAAAGPIPLCAEPGNPPAIVIGAPLDELGPAAMRFAAARALRLTATHLDALLAVPQEEAGALLVGIIRQFVADYHHADVRETLVAVEAARAERAIPRKLKPQLMPFAVESAGPFDLAALYAAVRDGANAVGLLAAADLPAALSVILELAGTIVVAPTAAGPGPSLEAIGANPEAVALLRFAVSDEYDELARALEA